MQEQTLWNAGIGHQNHWILEQFDTEISISCNRSEDSLGHCSRGMGAVYAASHSSWRLSQTSLKGLLQVSEGHCSKWTAASCDPVLALMTSGQKAKSISHAHCFSPGLVSRLLLALYLFSFPLYPLAPQNSRSPCSLINSVRPVT